MTTGPKGLTLSKWQGASANLPLLFDLAEEPYHFVGIRGTIGNDYRDPLFDMYWRQCDGWIARGPYHVLRPEYPGHEQIRRAVTVHGMAKGGELGRIIDWEPTSGGLPHWTILRDACQFAADHDGIPPIVYSRYRVINENIPPDEIEFLLETWLWLAQYLWWQTTRGEHPPPYTIPNGISPDLVRFMQTSDRLAPPVQAAFPDSNTLTTERWQGSMDLLRNFLHVRGGGSAPLTLEQRVDRIEAFLDRQHHDTWPPADFVG